MNARSGDTLTLDVSEGAGAAHWLSRFNPAAKIVAALVLAFGLIPATDPVTAGVVLAAAVVLVPFSGVDRRTLLVLGLPFLLMGSSTLLVNLLYGDQGAEGALGAAVRVLAIALPGLLVAISSDPTDLSDGLVQRLKVPERPAMGVLAALRLVPLLAHQWRSVTFARRARGIAAGGNPFRAVALFFGRLFSLLVRSVRTGTLLATAMDARAFGTGPRTRARHSRWGRRDTLLVAAAPALLAAAYGISHSAGTLSPVWQMK
ncbi:energy-coupling factor transporter transmembrane component T family protein [Nocardiopsis salina]|uniref:energy-coupling factor transporter transmembrane component T family protein n=1 Tax=Nocardiopsis salina TaxID=245836 RepID=UPI0003451B11|nr:energy-coupling factor transporter transmembrane component T [Nocardiopsis salina]